MKCICVLENKSCRRDVFPRDIDFFLKFEDHAIKITEMFYLIEGQGDQFRLEITIYASKMRGSGMENCGYNNP